MLPSITPEKTTIANDAIITAKIKDGEVTDAKIASVSGSKVTGDITGKCSQCNRGCSCKSWRYRCEYTYWFGKKVMEQGLSQLLWPIPIIYRQLRVLPFRRQMETGGLTAATVWYRLLHQQTSGNAILKGDNAGGFANAAAGTDYVAPNTAIAGATKTKITYDAKGLVTAACRCYDR